MSFRRPASMLLRLRNVCILDALRLEEALFRADSRSWLITNEWDPKGGTCSVTGKSRTPEEAVAIVLGISGKPEEMVHTARAAAEGVPLIKRFTGGGTVVVDKDTMFVSFITAPGALPEVKPYPDTILAWTTDVYAEALSSCGVRGFATKANDYCIDDRKFGGNAQSISGKRWMHHTSLLWDYDPARMSLLKMPSRRPEYRADRSHDDFVRALSANVALRRSEVLNAIVRAASKRLDLKEVGMDSAADALSAAHRKTTTVLDLGERSEHQPKD